MIVDKLSNIGRYALIIKDCEELAVFFRTHDFSTLSGKHAVEGSDMVIAPFEYDTKLTSRWETHHTHMDIHIVIEGADEVEWIPAQHISQSTEYVSERDVEFFADSVQGSRVRVEAGYFCLVMPEDAHKPAMAIGGISTHGKKCVIKREVL
jgi:YhcH/YjgK/YiaL family protein